MTEIDGEEHASGDGVARIRADLNKPDRGASIGRMRMADPVDCIYHPGGSDQRVAAPRHRCRTGVRLLSGDGNLVPALALRAGYDADRLLGGFEDRALLDMRLEIGGDGPAAYRFRAGKADPLEFGAERDAGKIVRPCQTFAEIEDAREHAGTDHRRRKPRSFLVGPGDDFDRRLGLVTEIVEGPHQFEPGHDAIGAVEFAAGRLRV